MKTEKGFRSPNPPSPTQISDLSSAIVKALSSDRKSEKPSVELRPKFNPAILSSFEEYINTLSPKRLEVLEVVVRFYFEYETVYFSHAYIAKKCGCDVSWVKRVLDEFRADGLFATEYRHRKTCFYFISPDFFRENILEVLNRFIYKASFVFYLGLLASRPITAQVLEWAHPDKTLPRRREIYIKELLLVKSIRNSSFVAEKTKDSNKNVKLAPKTTPEERELERINKKRLLTWDEYKIWSRDSSFHEKLVLEGGLNTGYKDPFLPEYQAKKYEKRRKELPLFCLIPQLQTQDSQKGVTPKPINLPPCPIREDFVSEFPDLDNCKRDEKIHVRTLIRNIVRKDEIRYCRARNAWKKQRDSLSKRADECIV